MAFTARELALMQETQEDWLPERVTIKRRNLTDDGFGGVNSGALTTVATQVRARITQAQVQATGGQLQRDLLLEKWTIRLPIGTDVAEEDRIEWIVDGNTKTIEVEDVKLRSHATVISIMGELVK